MGVGAMPIIGRGSLYSRLGVRGLRRSDFYSDSEGGLHEMTKVISIYKTPRPVIIIRAEDAEAAGVRPLPKFERPKKNKDPFL